MLKMTEGKKNFLINPLFIFIEKQLLENSENSLFSANLKYKKKEQASVLNSARIQGTDSREVYFIEFSSSSDQEKFFEYEYVSSHLSIDKYLERVTLESGRTQWSHAHLTFHYKNDSDKSVAKFHIYYDQYGKILEYTAHRIKDTVNGEAIKERWHIKKEELSLKWTP